MYFGAQNQMSTKWQRINLDIPKNFSPAEREYLGQTIVEFIRERVQSKNLDKNNNPFPGYSKEYERSLNFKIAGKSKGDVNLTLSGDMMGALSVLSHKRGKVTIGFENGTLENSVADGNIRGTYGQSKPTGKARNFLGLTKDDLKRLVSMVKDQVESDDMAKADEIAKRAVDGMDDPVDTEDSEDSD